MPKKRTRSLTAVAMTDVKSSLRVAVSFVRRVTRRPTGFSSKYRMGRRWRWANSLPRMMTTAFSPSAFRP